MIEIEIERRHALPCCLKVFKINGKSASEYDFGEGRLSGYAMDGTCRHEFDPKMPTEEVLNKYDITLSEYAEIVDRLKDELYVGGCGWCS